MFGREMWMSVASEADEEIRERILTGYKDGKPFTPYVPTVWDQLKHDPVTHQLHVIGRTSFDEARCCAGDRHFELLLRSTRRT